MGRPAKAYDEKGEPVWQVEFDIYGRIRENLFNKKLFNPFRQLGQYEDVETELYYNRFHHYNPETSSYINQDPIGLAGNNPNFYAYVYDSNTMVDLFGLDELDLLNKKLSNLENAHKDAVRVRELTDGRTRYYGIEKPSRNPGPTRGASYVIEYSPSNGNVRSWCESYVHNGNVNRVHPKT